VKLVARRDRLPVSLWPERSASSSAIGPMY
jgi:hypothetical protein